MSLRSPAQHERTGPSALPDGLSPDTLAAETVAEQIERSSRGAGMHCLGSLATGFGAVVIMRSIETHPFQWRSLVLWLFFVVIAAAALFEVLVHNRRIPPRARTIDVPLMVVATTGLLVGSIGWFDLASLHSDGTAFAACAIVLAFCAGSLVALNPLCVLIAASVIPAVLSLATSLFVVGKPAPAVCALAVLAIILQSLPNMRRNIEELVRGRLIAQHASLHDPMTGALNRAGLALHVRANSTVIHVDVDEFKAINDNFGHATGDKVLCELADRLEQVAASFGAIVARVGGDEFVVALRDTSSDQRRLLVDGLVATASATFDTVGVVDVSFGIATLGPDDDLSVALSRADDALYVAKSSSGRRAVWNTDGPKLRSVR